MLWARHGVPLLVLAVQSALLFARLDLLPVWPDEAFTYETVLRSPTEILDIARKDVHPPLYYLLLHFWPFHTLAGMRALSAVWALAATLILDLCWTSRWRPQPRAAALALFALSPCLLLYGRMARSYTMQLALALLAIHYLWQCRRQAREPRQYWQAPVSCLALLYTHYAPGLAILAAYSVLSWRGMADFRRLAALLSMVAVGYLPWMLALTDVLNRWTKGGGFSSRYLVTGSPWAEHVIKLSYGATSLTIGETFPAPLLLVVPLLSILAGLGLLRLWRKDRALAAFLCIASIVGYIGVSRWVSFPFVPARLLWLLPFVSMGAVLGAGRRLWLVAIALVSHAVSIGCYFRQEPFLNKAYVAPIREIAAILKRDAGPRDLILGDAYNADNGTLHFYLTPPQKNVLILPENQAQLVQQAAAAPTVWVIRNPRDLSPGRLTSRTIESICADRTVHGTPFLPYSWWERRLLQQLSPPPTPAHFYELLSCTSATSQPVEPHR